MVGNNDRGLPVAVPVKEKPTLLPSLSKLFAKQANNRPKFDRIPSENVVTERSDDTDDPYSSVPRSFSSSRQRGRGKRQSLKMQRFFFALCVSLFCSSLVLLPAIVALAIGKRIEESNPEDTDSSHNDIIKDNTTIIDSSDDPLAEDELLIKNEANSSKILPPLEDFESFDNFTVTPRNKTLPPETKAPDISERHQFLLNILKTVSPEQSLLDENSPQFQALQWLLEGDQDYSNPIGRQRIGSLSEEEKIIQRYILAVLYFATNGPSSWINQADFMVHSQSVCQWGHVDKASGGDDGGGSPSFAKIQCQGDRLTGLFIENNGLRGRIPDEIGFLTELENLTLIRNRRLKGSIPSGIGNLVNLKALHLFENNFSGTLPVTIGLLNDTLTLLDVAQNRLVGHLPMELGDLANLRELYLEFNRFQGSVPTSMQNMDQLVTLNIQGNEFTGEVDSMFCPLSRSNLELVADCNEVRCSCCTTCCFLDQGSKQTGDEACYV